MREFVCAWIPVGLAALLGCTSPPPIDAPDAIKGVDAGIERAEQLFRSCAYDESEKLLTELLPTAKPSDAALIKTHLADLAWRRGDLDQVIALLRESLQGDYFDGRSLLVVEENLGEALALRSRYEEAIREFKVMLKVRQLLGERLSQRRGNGAVRELSSSGFILLAVALAEQGQLADAKVALDSLLDGRGGTSPTALQLRSAVTDALEGKAAKGPGEFRRIVIGDEFVAGSDKAFVPPIPMKTDPPQYPHWAALDRVEGEVVLGFRVTVEGRATDIRVLESRPPRVFDQAALQVARDWTFKPAIKDCHPVEQAVVQHLSFRLAE